MPRLDDVVGVHEENAVVGVDLRVVFEGVVLAVEHLHPAVGHRAHRGNAVVAVGDRAGGRRAAADVGRARAQDRRVVALGAAGAEFGDRPPLGGAAHAVGLGRHERLVVDGEQHHRLDHLRLDDRAAHHHDRLVGEHRRALPHRPDVAGEPEILQVGQERLAELSLAAQKLDVLLGEFQILDVLDQLLEPREYCETSVVRNLPEEHGRRPPCAPRAHIPDSRWTS